MKLILFAVLTCLASIFASTDTRPNVLVVMIDDLGASDLGIKDPDFYTPSLDALAEDGVFLDRFYTSPTCTPSRAQLMTGIYNFRIGMQDSVIHATEPRGVPLEYEFLSQKVKNNGYSTAALGKWHLGMHAEAYLPRSRGFDRHYGIYTGGGDHFAHVSVSSFSSRGREDVNSFYGYNLWEDGEVSEDNYGRTHSTTLYNNKAVQYIKEFTTTEGRKPFFMYLAYQAVHDPIDTEAWSVQNTSCHRVHDRGQGSEIDITNRVKLCGMMAMVDDGITQIRNQLIESGEWTNTVVFFMSDNGGKMAHGSSNYPYRGEKGYYYEGGVRVPAFVSGGYLMKALKQNGLEGYTYDGLVHVTDFHATVLGLAGLPTDGIDGIDHWATWTSSPSVEPRDEVVINFNSDPWGGSMAYVSGDFKIIVNPNPMEAKIYNKVRDSLAMSAASTEEEVKALVEAASSEVLDTECLLFNIRENPSELDQVACSTPSACKNLWDLDAFAYIKSKMLDRIKELRSQMALSTFAWADDGALAHPNNFGGVWSPWRDDQGAPFAAYTGVVALLFDQSLYDYLVLNLDSSAKTPTTQMAAQSSQSVISAALSEISALTLAVTALVVGTAIVAYNAGRRHGYRELTL